MCCSIEAYFQRVKRIFLAAIGARLDQYNKYNTTIMHVYSTNNILTKTTITFAGAVCAIAVQQMETMVRVFERSMQVQGSVVVEIVKQDENLVISDL